MSLTLSREDEAVIERLLASGRFQTARDVVQAGLRKLEDDPRPEFEKFPKGSLAHLHTKESNAEELELAKGSSLITEDE